MALGKKELGRETNIKRTLWWSVVIRGEVNKRISGYNIKGVKRQLSINTQCLW